MGTPKITKDIANKRLIVERIFEAGQERVWSAWTKAELLVKWWGPKGWPASSQSFDFRVGGHWHFFMTGPDGTRVWGWLEYTAITPMYFIAANDFFSDAQGTKLPGQPLTVWEVQFKKSNTATQVTATLSFATAADMQKIVDMGFEAGFTSALENLEELLA